MVLDVYTYGFIRRWVCAIHTCLSSCVTETYAITFDVQGFSRDLSKFSKATIRLGPCYDVVPKLLQQNHFPSVFFPTFSSFLLLDHSGVHEGNAALPTPGLWVYI